MQQYNKILSERYNLHQEIGAIRGQNDELKLLLRQYLTAKVNDDLEVPPTKVLLGHM